MKQGGFSFPIILIGNALIAVAYLLWHLLFLKEDEHRAQYVIYSVIMLLCPIVGALYFLLAYLKCRFLPMGIRDLTDVEFSKKRHLARLKADEERERNIVSVEEAILVSDQKRKRINMLNILLGNTDESFAAIAQALNSDDSEVAHYAASFLQSKMDNFRDTVRKKQQSLQDETLTEEAYAAITLDLIRYMNQMLKQTVFVQVEQKDYVNQMDDLCERLFQKAPSAMQPECYEWILCRTMEVQNYPRADLWGQRLYDQYPEHLSAYKLRLKLYFETGRREQFFQVLDLLLASSVVPDSQTLQLIRMFRGEAT